MLVLAAAVVSAFSVMTVRADDGSPYLESPMDGRFEKTKLLNILSRIFPSSQQARYLYDDLLYGGAKRSIGGPAPGFVGARGKKGGVPGFVGARGKRFWIGSTEERRR
ncbi:uncharacterized protein LOC111251926 isoform X1 [Varroa destructor]|uniref:Uncharacterized protein n=2 Tax=Varroa TaxID=62624 RepID=A0A7M7KFC4_VARDE|nr:uncharacterized protein LOC111251926 isoform X1 [Varroa destructor]